MTIARRGGCPAPVEEATPNAPVNAPRTPREKANALMEDAQRAVDAKDWKRCLADVAQVEALDAGADLANEARIGRGTCEQRSPAEFNSLPPAGDR